MGYLGCTIASDGSITTELSKRLGCAWADFQKLAQLWKHASLTLAWKLQAFNHIIVTQLLYGLSSTWLNAKSRRKLDGFQSRCLRVILKIKPSYYSRVSNQTVLDKAAASKMSSMLLRQQLVLFGNVACAPDEEVLRRMVFRPGSLDLIANCYIRRVGRPRNEWGTCLHKEAVKVVGGTVPLQAAIQNPDGWKAMVTKACSHPR